MKEIGNKKNNDKNITVIALGILTAILTITNLWTFFVYAPDETNISKESASGKFEFLDPARKLIDKQDLIINVQPLREYLDEKYKKDLNVSIYFEYLPTGASIATNKDAEFYPASLLKVPAAMAVAKKIEKGEWKWTNKLVLMSSDRDDKFGSLHKESTGSTFTIEELVRRSLADSDNTAHFILVRNLETEEIDDVYEHMGLKGFLSTNGNLSAKRYSVIFRTLYNSSYLSDENSQKLLNFLSQSPFKDYIQSALPQDIIFSHKIGIDREKEIYLDSGLIYFKNRPYLLTIMIRDNNEKMAMEKMEDVSEKTYAYIRDYHEENN
ncbi:MAG: serine hydrolase [Candidatus Paceibacterota bacterium]|jgi:hypothetical protein